MKSKILLILTILAGLLVLAGCSDPALETNGSEYNLLIMNAASRNNGMKFTVVAPVYDPNYWNKQLDMYGERVPLPEWTINVKVSLDGTVKQTYKFNYEEDKSGSGVTTDKSYSRSYYRRKGFKEYGPTYAYTITLSGLTNLKEYKVEASVTYDNISKIKGSTVSESIIPAKYHKNAIVYSDGTVSAEYTSSKTPYAIIIVPQTKADENAVAVQATKDGSVIWWSEDKNLGNRGVYVPELIGNTDGKRWLELTKKYYKENCPADWDSAKNTFTDSFLEKNGNGIKYLMDVGEDWYIPSFDQFTNLYRHHTGLGTYYFYTSTAKKPVNKIDTIKGWHYEPTYKKGELVSFEYTDNAASMSNIYTDGNYNTKLIICHDYNEVK